MHGYWFKKFTSISDRLAIDMNRYQQETDITNWMTKGKTTLVQKDTPKRNLPRQQQTYYVRTDNMKNTNGTNK